MGLLANFFRQKAAIRSQKIGLKAAAAKRPHFAHGCSIVIISPVKSLPSSFVEPLMNANISCFHRATRSMQLSHSSPSR